MKEISAFLRRDQRTGSIFPAQVDTLGSRQSAPRRGTSPEPDSDLRLPASRTVRNKSPLFISHLVCGNLLQQSQLMETLVKCLIHSKQHTRFLHICTMKKMALATGNRIISVQVLKGIDSPFLGLDVFLQRRVIYRACEQMWVERRGDWDHGDLHQLCQLMLVAQDYGSSVSRGSAHCLGIWFLAPRVRVHDNSLSIYFVLSSITYTPRSALRSVLGSRCSSLMDKEMEIQEG